MKPFIIINGCVLLTWPLPRNNEPQGKPDKPGKDKVADTSKSKTDSSYVANTNKIPKLIERGEAVGKIAPTFLKTAGKDGKSAPVPNTALRNEICLAWHIKGGCCSNCQRLKSNSTAHGSLTDPDVETLCQFIDAGLEKSKRSERPAKEYRVTNAPLILRLAGHLLHTLTQALQ
jgi:hypothetical protein